MKRWGAVLVVALLATGLTSPVGAAPTFLTTEAVSSGNAVAASIHSAIAATGVAAVTYTDDSVPTVARVAVHRPGGSWSTPAALSNTANASTASGVAVSSAGQVDGVFRTVESAQLVVKARRIKADGTTEAEKAISDPANLNTPSVAAIGENARGDVAVAWSQFSDGSPRVFLRSRPAGASSWSAIIPISDGTTGAGYDAYLPQVFVAPDGDVVVAWLQESGVPGFSPKLVAVPAGSVTPGTTQSAGSMQVNPASAVAPLRIAGDSGGRVVLSVLDVGIPVHAWGVYWDRTNAPVAHDAGAATEAAPGFSGAGLPFVAALGTDLVLDQRSSNGTWSPTTMWVTPVVTQLSAGWDERGRVLLAVNEAGNVATTSKVGSTVVPHSQVADGGGAFAVADAHMTPSGDAVITWWGNLDGALGQTVNATPYDVAGPTTALNALPTWTLTSRRSLHWTTRDTWATSATSAVRRESAPASGGFGPWSVVATTGQTSASVGVARGATTCFAVRATDPSANTGPWSTSRCTAAPVDDRSLAGRTKWRKLTGSSYYAGTALTTKAKGRALTFRATGKRLVLVASRCGTCGTVKLLVNGVLVRTISLQGRAANRVVIPIKAYSSVRTLKVRLVTTSAKKVVVDGLGVSRA